MIKIFFTHKFTLHSRDNNYSEVNNSKSTLSPLYLTPRVMIILLVFNISYSESYFNLKNNTSGRLASKN